MVKAVGSAAEGLAVLDQTAIDLVLTDLAMPDMDGLEATKRIKARAASPKVVIQTLHNVDTYRGAAQDAGADGFLNKAQLGEELIPLIEHLFSKGGE